MATKYLKTARTGNTGVAFVETVATKAGAIFRPFDSNDLGVDGAIELLTDKREPNGNIVPVQIKAGTSYIRQGKFFVDADRDHFESWSRYALPVVGIVCDGKGKTARWVDISDHLRCNPEVVAKGPFSIEAPVKNEFSLRGFDQFISRFRPVTTTGTQVTATPI